MRGGEPKEGEGLPEGRNDHLQGDPRSHRSSQLILAYRTQEPPKTIPNPSPVLGSAKTDAIR